MLSYGKAQQQVMSVLKAQAASSMFLCAPFVPSVFLHLHIFPEHYLSYSVRRSCTRSGMLSS